METRDYGSIELHDGDFLAEVTTGMEVHIAGNATIGVVSGGRVHVFRGAALVIAGDVSCGCVRVHDGSSLTIDGDVSGGCVYAFRASAVTILGDVTGGCVHAFDGKNFRFEKGERKYD